MVPVEMETVIVSFGSPRRGKTGDFWTTPKSALSTSGDEVIVAPHPEKGWDAPEVTSPLGAKIISSKRTPGSNGGYVAVEVGVPISAELANSFSIKEKELAPPPPPPPPPHWTEYVRKEPQDIQTETWGDDYFGFRGD